MIFRPSWLKAYQNKNKDNAFGVGTKLPKLNEMMFPGKLDRVKINGESSVETIRSNIIPFPTKKFINLNKRS